MTRIFLLFVLLCSGCFAHAQQETEESLLNSGSLFSMDPLDESAFDENGSTMFILDNTKTKIGRDLYEEFYRQWAGMQLDSAGKAQFNSSVKANEELIIEMEEIPSPGLSNMVAIKVGDLLVWQQFVQPRSEAMEAQVAEAVQYVLQYFIGYQEIQNQLGTKDQSGSGIF
ncbi:MAG TPA: CsgE family curli-type amyloid fiber assembly protein [Dyadobacter sp.]|jgi:curli production assembly/transport component CsgE|nr:CsgE family curli-type amyloid fiber assembly protein [Dyadobacter sp.]